jgi:hypothetical protein
LDGLIIARNNFVCVRNTAPNFGTGSLAVYSEYSYDPFVKNCAIYGFAQAISTLNSARVKITDVNIDCAAGVLINLSADISYLTRVHCWPFTNHIAGFGQPIPPATVSTDSAADPVLQRSGSAFKLTGLNDWTKITDCFSYAYKVGYDILAGDEIMLTGCGADQTPNAYFASAGFSINANATNVSMVNCQAAGQYNGFYISGTATNTTRMVNCSVWQSTSNGVVNTAGILTIFGGTIRGNNVGISIAGTVYASGVRLTGNSTNGTPLAMPATITI